MKLRGRKITYGEFIEFLRQNNAKVDGYLSTDQLRTLTQQMSVELPKLPGAVTLLYSGPAAQDAGTGGEFGGVRSGQLAVAMANNGNGMVRIIDHTDAGRIVGGVDFLEAATKAFGDPQLAKNFIYGATDATGKRTSMGLFDDLSARFITASAGTDFRAIVPFAAEDRVFAQTEILRLLQEPQVSSINGVAKDVFLRIHSAVGIDGVLDAVRFTSAELMRDVRVGSVGGS